MYSYEHWNQHKKSTLTLFLEMLERWDLESSEPTFVSVNETLPIEDSTGIQIHKYKQLNENGKTVYKYRLETVVNGDVKAEIFCDQCPKVAQNSETRSGIIAKGDYCNIDFDKIKHIAITKEGNIASEVSY